MDNAGSPDASVVTGRTLPGDGGALLDDDGIRVDEAERGVFDVLFDGRRVWSFNAARDGEPTKGRFRTVRWPAALRQRLHGTATVTVREHLAPRVLFDDEHVFGDGEERVEIIDGSGTPLAMEKGGRLVPTFSQGGQQFVEPLLDAILDVLRVLREEARLPAFLAFGALLGAVRDGHFIGHDSDADVSYLSAYQHPADITRESFQLQRLVQGAGWRTRRYSAADFKVFVDTPEGSKGLDVFAGFVVYDTFYMMPSVHASSWESMLLPIGEVELEGRPVPAPADPEALLEATYGPDWRTPDPAFKFAPPPWLVRRRNGWTRAEIANRAYWTPFYAGKSVAAVPEDPSQFARWVSEQETGHATLVDVGFGTGRDALWFARKECEVLGLDYAPSATERAKDIADAEGIPAVFETFNLYDVRQVLTTGALLAHGPAPPTLYGRFLLHALTDVGRRNLWRMASMCLRRGGRMYLEFRTNADAKSPHEFGKHFRKYLDPDDVVAEIESLGGRVERRDEGHGMAVYKEEDPHVCRLVVTWKR